MVAWTESTNKAGESGYIKKLSNKIDNSISHVAKRLESSLVKLYYMKIISSIIRRVEHLI